ncbi:MAG: sodium:calcium exchanger [Dolichospermum circinale Clear-D4]|nr:sodium:calcium exchanger [Dolichospermum circinale Clear-D4]
MNTLLNSALTLTYNQLSTFADLDNFWNLFDTAFGTQYNRSGAEILRLQWLSGDFSQLPQIEILDSSILGNANGAYASSNNQIYLSANFLATSTAEAISAVLLEEIGHFIDAQINQTDSAGDEGAIFAALVQGESLDSGTLQALKAEDDHATITVNGEVIQVEQQNFTGTNGNDTIVGTSGDDTISPLRGIDTVDGGAGDDLLILDYSSNNYSGVQSYSYYGYYYKYLAYYNSSSYDQVTYSNIERFQITGTAVDDSIYTGSGNDNIAGGLGNDTINGGDGNNTIDGGDGNDNIITGSGNDNITGGLGNDTINGGDGNNTIDGGDGNDNIITGSGNDNITGGLGNDTINGGDGNNTINGGDGNDTITTGSGNDNITGGLGDDTINAGNGDDILIGGAGNDYINAGFGNDTIDGGDGVDTLNKDFTNITTAITFDTTGVTPIVPTGTSVTNVEAFELTTGGGNDTIKLAGRFNDNLNTGAGNDTITPGLGIDTVDGGAGDDLLILDYSSNNYSGVQSYSYYGYYYKYLAYYNSSSYDQVTYSNIERFQITGTAVDDSIYTGSGNDNIAGGLGDDYISGGDGNDTINGGAGNDTINAGDGNDNIDGVNGASLTPGLGEKDTLTGGTGSDRFILGNATKAYYDDGNTLTNGGNDYADITDFNIADGDIIQLQGTSSNYLLAVVSADTQILINKPGTEPDELIGIVRNQTALSLTGTYFSYVSNVTLPSITLAVSPTSVTEDGTTNLIYTFTRTGVTTSALTVNYGITGTADSSDYTGAIPGTGKTITFAAGASTATLTIDPTADTIVESNETVALTLATGTDYTIGTTTAVIGTITNDDFDLPTITLAVSPTSVSEDGTTNLIYIFTRTGATTNALTVNYGITGTANTSDYTGATPGTGKTITFAAGASTATLTIDPTADTIVESNETVALTLATGTGYNIGTTTAVIGTITNDDLLPNLNLSANQTIVEGNTNTQNVTYTVTLSKTSTQTITVQYATANGTAIAGLDYTSTSGTLTFNPGVTSQVINIPILNDSLNEANETFTLNLTTATNATLGTAKTATTTITDTLSASVTTTLPGGVENLTLTGTAAINGTGNANNNVFQGNSANNTLSGLDGNDTYRFLANTALGTDTITETTTGGIDNLDFTGTTAAVNVNLGITTSQTVNSNLKLILSANNVIENATGGTGNDRLTGNALNNTLNGGSGNDQLQGLGGNDTLWGGAGNDILNGGTGNDSLWGGLGDDILTGGVGNDQYLFQGDSVFSTSLGVDYISEFELGLDQIVLSKATFNAITNAVGQALTDFAVVSDDEFVNASSARIVFSQGTGSLFYNQDGSILGTGTVFEFARLGNPDITLTSSNFSLIA